MSNSIKSTEFWLSLIAVLLGTLTTAGVFDAAGLPEWVMKVSGLATAVLAALGYTAARGIVKKAEATAETKK